MRSRISWEVNDMTLSIIQIALSAVQIILSLEIIGILLSDREDK